MCGIVGYIGNRQAAPILLDALKRLEYRGYDSAGIATVTDKIHVKKDAGKINEIDRRLKLDDLPGFVGIGHTRWATHGKPSRANAHPHLDSFGKVVVAHNGIIENYVELRKFLQEKGHRFVSDTDTEVIPNLIAYFIRKGKSFETSVKEAAKRLKGSYALAILNVDEPEKIIAVRKESPLIVGLGSGEMFLASDIPAVLSHTKRFVVLENDEMAVLISDKVVIKCITSGAIVKKRPMTVTWTAAMAEKEGYPHFTLKEINQQPDAVCDTLRAAPSELEKLANLVSNAKRVYIVACGTSYHAALVGKYALAKFVDLPVEAIISSEFQESCIVDKNSVVIAITQSGETADTLKAVKVAKLAGAKIACLTNVVGSSITRESDVVCYTYAGPEVSVIATKTFAAQIAYLSLFAIYLAEKKGQLLEREVGELLVKLRAIPDALHAIINSIAPQIKKLARRYRGVEHFYLIGRGIGYPIVMEGALKLKEVTYIHSEAMPAGELKHGTLALIEKGTPVIAVVPPGNARIRMLGNIEEVKARGATVIAVAESGDEVKKHVNEFIPMPQTEEFFSPLLYILPLQLLAYHIAVENGQDPDKPKNLAKSVTVE